MPNPDIMRFASTLALVLVVLSGRVLDRTTGQPLPNVRITTATGARATSDAKGRYALRGAARGTLVLTLESDDVPPQHVEVRVGGAATHRDLRACSTTLDYTCGTHAPSDGGPQGAG